MMSIGMDRESIGQPVLPSLSIDILQFKKAFVKLISFAVF